MCETPQAAGNLLVVANRPMVNVLYEAEVQAASAVTLPKQ